MLPDIKLMWSRVPPTCKIEKALTLSKATTNHGWISNACSFEIAMETWRRLIHTFALLSAQLLSRVELAARLAMNSISTCVCLMSEMTEDAPDGSSI